MGHIAKVTTQPKDAGERHVTDEYVDPRGESELRRRAAWLLLMLVLVAALLVVLMVLFLRSGTAPSAPKGIKPIPTGPPSPAPSQGNPHQHRHQHPGGRAHSASNSVTIPTHMTHHRVSCPSDAPCIAHGDIGNAVAAVNAYRAQHGQPAVSGKVTPNAQTCAVSNGNQCSGSWAETQLPTANGKLAAQKVSSFTDLLSTSITSVQVGWAYDPTAHQYYFAIITNSS
jgi:predicted nucleic acid-binding Zn ribbon protein